MCLSAGFTVLQIPLCAHKVRGGGGGGGDKRRQKRVRWEKGMGEMEGRGIGLAMCLSVGFAVPCSQTQSCAHNADCRERNVP